MRSSAAATVLGLRNTQLAISLCVGDGPRFFKAYMMATCTPDVPNCLSSLSLARSIPSLT